MRGVIGLLALAVQAAAAAGAPTLDDVNRLLEKGAYAEARTAAEALAAAEARAGRTAGVGRAYLLIADSEYYLGRPDAYRTWVEKALAACRSSGDPACIGRSYYDLAYVHERTEPKEMIALLDRAAGFASRAGDRHLEMNVENALGQAHFNLSRFAVSAGHFAKAERLAALQGDDNGRATALQNLGACAEDRARHEEALAHYREALAIFTRLERPPGIALVLQNMGNVFSSLGDTDEALAHYRRALALFELIGHKRGEATTLMQSGGVYRELGEVDRALDVMRKAVALTAALHDDRNGVQILIELSGLLVESGRIDEAGTNLADAATRAERIGDPRLAFRVALARSRLEQARSEPEAALAWIDRAESHARRVEGDDLATCHAARGEALRRAGRPEDALHEYETAVRLFEESHTETGLHVLYGRIGELRAARGEPDAARAAFEESLRQVERRDRLAVFDRTRVSLFVDAADVFRSYAGWLAGRGEVGRAWEVVEAGRARALRVRLARPGGDDLTPGERDALARLSALQRRLREESLDAAGRERLLAGVREAEYEYDDARRNAAGATSGPSGVIPDLPEPEIVVEYAVCGDELLVFSRRRARAPRVRRVADARGVLARAGALWRAASTAAEPYPVGEAKALERVLIDDELRGLPAGLVVIVPDEALHALPFSALVGDDDRFLCERFAFSEAQSLAALAGLRARRRAPAEVRVLAVANTRFDGEALAGLRGTAREASSVAAAARGTRLLIDGSEAALKTLHLADFGLVHFATHTRVDERRPERSSIVLAPGGGEDGDLQAREIETLQLDARLVVVSGCASGRGRVVPGEGVVGLPYALFGAGADSVVTSLWDVSDSGAAAFMARFYAALRHGTVAAALQAAQQGALRAQPRHPADWAAFTVSGDADVRVLLPGAPFDIVLAVETALGIVLLATALAVWGRRRRGV